MKLLYKFILIFLAAVALHPCVAKQSEPVVELSSKVTHSFEGFVRDTSAYAMVVDTSVRESVFKENLVPVEKGGFVEFFANDPEKRNGVNRNKIFYAYSDSLSQFVKDRSENSSFLDVVALAYANHYPMEISPDDIWLMILDGFRLHVKNNRKTLKKRFVAPGADTVISIDDNSLTFESTHNEWFWTIANLFESLRSKLPQKTGNPLKTKFSTTSPIDNNISRTMTLAIAAEYYSFIVWTSCGIPKIKVNGTKEDWILLKNSFNKLALQLNMKWWANGLNPVLDEFINIFEGKINLEYWKGFYKYYEARGCSSPDFNGWISRFFPYTKELTRKGEVFVKHTDWNKRIDFKSVPRGVTFVDVMWKYFEKDIPLKLYTGFIGIQVDTTTKMLKAARGYALIAYGVMDFKKIAKEIKYIPGKAFHLYETLSISDSMNVYGEKGLIYSTHDIDEIENFARMSSFDEEYLEPDLWRVKEFKWGEPNLSINLYRNGELLDHLSYYAHSEKANGGALRSFKGAGFWEKNAAIKKFFKQRNIPINGTVNEFPNEKMLPKLNVEIFVDTVVLKDGKTFDGKMDDLRLGIVRTLNYSCGWRLERAIYHHYKDDFKDSIVAMISYKDEGHVDSISMDLKPEIHSLQEEIRSILNYAWMPPERNSGASLQDIVDKIKLRITYSRDYRMVCKQNGRKAKDSVDIDGLTGEGKALCSEITFSKDMATGEIYRYKCYEFNLRIESFKPVKIIPVYEAANFDKYEMGNLYYLFNRKQKKLKDQFVTLKIPPCFEEE